MATIESSGYTAAAVTALTTELDGLANNTNSAASAAFDNATEKAIWHDLELAVTFGTAPADNSPVELYLLPSVDGTNYPDGGGTVTPRPNLLAGVFFMRNITTAQRHVVQRIEVPPGLFKYVLRNASGQAFSASGHTLKYRPHEMQSV